MWLIIYKYDSIVGSTYKEYIMASHVWETTLKSPDNISVKYIGHIGYCYIYLLMCSYTKMCFRIVEFSCESCSKNIFAYISYIKSFKKF